MLNELNKNIQLSEKIEFLMTNGLLTLNSNVEGNPVYRYQNISMKIDANKVGGRVLDFVNGVIDKYGLYPLLQKYVVNKTNSIPSKLKTYPLTVKEMIRK